MMKYFLRIFYILHGLVHLLYMGHGLKYFELEKGFTWPNNSKFPANIFSLQTNRIIASVLCIIAAISFIVSGICFMMGHSWHNQEVIVAVITSTILFVTF